jgi:hypothetical protein
MRVYLDNCCFNRPYDDQTQILIKLETEAKLQIQQLILDNEFDLIWSFILHYENNDNPYSDKKERIAAWESIAKETVVFNEKLTLKKSTALPMIY